MVSLTGMGRILAVMLTLLLVRFRKHQDTLLVLVDWVLLFITSFITLNAV